jgi:hypothetical protein
MDNARVLDLLFRDRCLSVSSSKKEVIAQVYTMLDKHTFSVFTTGNVWTIAVRPGKELDYDEIRRMMMLPGRGRTKSR